MSVEETMTNRNQIDRLDDVIDQLAGLAAEMESGTDALGVAWALRQVRFVRDNLTKRLAPVPTVLLRDYTELL